MSEKLVHSWRPDFPNYEQVFQIMSRVRKTCNVVGKCGGRAIYQTCLMVLQSGLILVARQIALALVHRKRRCVRILVAPRHMGHLSKSRIVFFEGFGKCLAYHYAVTTEIP